MGLYDKSSKWLIQHHGDSILRLAGLRDLVSWRPLQAELVQPAQLPDGLLEAILSGRTDPDLFILEIATYPERRAYEQIFRDTALVYLDRRVLPEVLAIILRPKGNLRVDDSLTLQSPCGWTEWRARWRIVELWKLSADDLFALNDPGVLPWVPLTDFDDPTAILQECRDRIDRQAPAEQHENLLAVTQILAKLKYDDAHLLTILGGREAMIESPLIQELLAERMQDDIVTVLETRFQSVPADLKQLLKSVQDEARLQQLVKCAASCSDIESFRAELIS